MQALDLLLNRSSQPRLESPAPDGQVLQNILHAGMKVPDHGNLSPWKFVVCQGAGLGRLGDIFEQAAIEEQLTEREIQRAPQLPTRAPMVIVVIACYQQHDKVPWVEQVASASCAVYAMQLAALAQGFDGIWRSGIYTQSPYVKTAFNLQEQDEIVGFLYLGKSNVTSSGKPSKNLNDIVEFWD